MSEKHLDPAKTIIAALGGVEAVAKITGKHVSRVYRWMASKERGGTDGLIPIEQALKLLRHARTNGVPLSADDFLPLPEVTA